VTTTASNLVFGPNTNANPGLFIPSSVANLNQLTLNIAATNTVTLNSNIALSMATAGVLTLTQGLLVLGNFDLTIISTASMATITGGSLGAMVVADGTGYLKKAFPTATFAAFNYPVGDMTGATDYSPYNITFATNSVNRTIGVRVTDAIHPQNDVNGTQTDYASRYWTFIDNQGGNGTYTYSSSTFTYSTVAPSDVNGNTALYKVNRWDGSNWNQLASTVAPPIVSTSGTYTQTSGNLGLAGGVTVDYALRNNPPTVYTWNATSGVADWQVAANWTPARYTPAVNDILQFSNGGTPTANNVPTQTIGRLLVIGGTNVSLVSAAAVTLTI
jgi:hypothetical protein